MIEKLNPTTVLENISPTEKTGLSKDKFELPNMKDLPPILKGNDDLYDNKFLKLPNMKDLPSVFEKNGNIYDNETSKSFETEKNIQNLSKIDEASEKGVSDIQKITCRNESLAGREHPVTGVPYVEKVVENADGEKIKVVVPEFDSTFNAQLPENLYQATDSKQFSECNAQLKKAIKKDPQLKDKFTSEQLEQIENNDTPDGYTWHHHEEKGKMELVDSSIHNKTGHTGGKAIWGGGSENR